MTDPREGNRADALASAPAQTRDRIADMPAPAETAIPVPRGQACAASIAALQTLARQIGRSVLSTADVLAAHEARRAPGDKSLDYGTLRRRFGSFGEALESAGLSLARTTPLHSNLDCFANMEAVWRHHGRPPRMADMNRAPSTVGSGAYQKRAGSWRAAVEAYAAFTGIDPHRPGSPGIVGFGLPAKARADDDATRRPSGGGARNRVPDGRPAPLSLRFQVLQRDRFRCTACGNSPSRDPDCALQVDHIVPRARGGRSTAENLRCLCAACNLGRGARDADGRDAAAAEA